MHRYVCLVIFQQSPKLNFDGLIFLNRDYFCGNKWVSTHVPFFEFGFKLRDVHGDLRKK